MKCASIRYAGSHVCIREEFAGVEGGGGAMSDPRFSEDGLIGGGMTEVDSERTDVGDQHEGNLVAILGAAGTAIQHIKYSIACLLLAVSIANPVLAGTDEHR